ncbi:MAG: GMC family oxidoreductase [Bacteroidia bacterium]|nr:GMC family oxidoreductase [Bacteroidia bacterium]
MSEILGKAKAANTYDAIVIGSGISGGWAAKELCEKGLKTLVLERGRNVKHVIDYPTATKRPWEFEHAGKVPEDEVKKHYDKQVRQGGAFNQGSKHFWVKDDEHPYSEKKRFDWLRGYHVGGRSIIWGRQSYRWSQMDFESNEREGIAVPWPVTYKELAPWYDYVEGFAGINGQKEGLRQLPDGNFLPPMEMNCLEKHVKDSIATNFDDRLMTIGRSANLTKAHNGRTPCQYRNLCVRGCPYGAYFSSQSSTLPAAEATGNLTLRPNSIVSEIVVDKNTGLATGVRVMDAESKEVMEFYSKIVFSCASTFGSTLILMNSKSDIHPEGIGASSGELGHNIMDHHFRAGAEGKYDGFKDKYYKGRRPNGIYVPRFRNLPWNPASKMKDFIRGYGYQGSASRDNWSDAIPEMGFGADFKEQLKQPGQWSMGLNGFGEILPYHENKVTLNTEVLDKYGMPTLTFDVELKENELNMRKDMSAQAAEILEAAGFKDVKPYDKEYYPGNGIHEMGTARMGRSPKTSVLNKWNQVWDCKNVFVTDGSFMTSAACQNPSLTYMAFTARAVDHAVKELNKGNL